MQRLLGAVLVVGLLFMWLLARAPWWWLELLCVVVLLACAGGVFVISAWWFTRHHPVISVFNDRLWFRGLREEVVMLRNVAAAELVEARVAGLPRRWIELTVGDADAAQRVRLALDVVRADPGELLELIRQRAALQRATAAAP